MAQELQNSQIKLTVNEDGVKLPNGNFIPFIRSPQRKEAIWQVCYSFDGEDSFYLTDKEKKFLVTELQKGNKFVEIGGSLLSDKFLYVRLQELELLDKYRERTYEERFYIDAKGNRVSIGNFEVKN